MSYSLKNFLSADLTQAITLYKQTSRMNIMRNIPEATLHLIGHFKAAIDEANFTKPDPLIAQIYHIKKIFVRSSNLYRPDFCKDNYLAHKGNFMRIASVQYNRMNGISCCICYDIDIIKENLSL
ncbi:MAG: hypothetical protein ACJAQ0_000788 [Dasania sp.]|jgi:hypothetical protein